MFSVVFDEGDVHDTYGPFIDLTAAKGWADVNGGKVRLLKAPGRIPGLVETATQEVTVGIRP